MSLINKILLGNFLIEKNIFKNWKLVVYLFIMAIVMIFSSHLVDKKIIGYIVNPLFTMKSSNPRIQFV